ncbi:thioesterase family protein [Frankia sp. CNm7]|uniref:Thioesterase family protein n=1 Tax=Frankia nepalensis TaxID=1836974 RepID=A0A937UMV5_9ACTN|nr:acyl-CoA thioesterase domain-containing protein [Frankia nepalensis]MBL7496708.1 thioesterase family protein [Frankia nepalensis]MBL7511062.1 thioesterase family protein [Frankia nepalensis]MBL7516716.1 thioesterase family protein [Frankia nepalensis]MBL7627448.1 thioesterase family protein [Frankia nepalensis]
MHPPAHPLEAAQLDALDAVLGALRPERIAGDRFRMPSDAVRAPGRVYGGQLLAQALVAAGSSVTGKAPHSLHAAFVRAGTPGRPLDLAVDRVRDGRSMSTRQVTVLEEGKPLLVATVSFHGGGAESGATAPASAPPAPPPDDVPLLQQWARELPADQQQHGRHWIEQPPPVEIRIGEAPSFLGGPRARTSASAPRSHWMRLPRGVGDDPLLHTALLAYASDFLLMDVVFRAHPAAAGPGRSNGLSLDHAIWFHRPARFDRWHLHTQEALAVVGNRGLVRGAIHDTGGRLVATVMQEVLVLPVSAS